MVATTLAILALLVGSADGICTGITFFGEDRNPDDGQNAVLPLESTPNSDAARDLFFDQLVGAGTEDFEGDNITLGDTEPVLEFPGGVTATLNGGVVREDPPLNGQYAISQPTYFSTDNNFTIVFSEPVTALGFYGVDIGDVEGRLSFTAVQEDGTSCSLDIPHELNGPSGGVLYFAYIDLMPFTMVEFTNSEGERDRFSFDNFTIGLRENLDLCLSGITNSDESICCDANCGACGGCECELNPGGADLCCPGTIAASGIECVAVTDVACILDEYVPSLDGQCL